MKNLFGNFNDNNDPMGEDWTYIDPDGNKFTGRYFERNSIYGSLSSTISLIDCEILLENFSKVWNVNISQNLLRDYPQLEKKLFNYDNYLKNEWIEILEFDRYFNILMNEKLKYFFKKKDSELLNIFPHSYYRFKYEIKDSLLPNYRLQITEGQIFRFKHGGETENKDFIPNGKIVEKYFVKNGRLTEECLYYSNGKKCLEKIYSKETYLHKVYSKKGKLEKTLKIDDKNNVIDEIK